MTGSDRARPHAPSAPPPPPWRKVLATTIRLWWQRHVARPLAWRITVGALVVALVAASATAVVLGLRSAPGPSQAAVTKSQDPATDTAAVAAAAQYRQQAAAWVTAQVDHGAIVACDPLMCATLQQHGFPAAGLSSISAASSDPLGSGVVVSTAAVRDQLGSRLTSVYAPTVLASFGSGQGLVQVLVTAPGGAAAYRAALQSDVQARAGAGRQLLGNHNLEAAATARQQLAAGQVDMRLLLTLAALAHKYRLTILGFSDAGPGAAPSIPLRAATVTVAGTGQLRQVLAFLRIQRAPLLPLTSVSGSARAQVLQIEFTAPSPLGLLAQG